jgi:hypothetical protein
VRRNPSLSLTAAWAVVEPRRCGRRWGHCRRTEWRISADGGDDIHGSEVRVRFAVGDSSPVTLEKVGGRGRQVAWRWMVARRNRKVAGAPPQLRVALEGRSDRLDHGLIVIRHVTPSPPCRTLGVARDPSRVRTVPFIRTDRLTPPRSRSDHDQTRDALPTRSHARGPVTR